MNEVFHTQSEGALAISEAIDPRAAA